MKANTTKTRKFEVYNSVETEQGGIETLTKSQFINFISHTIELQKKYKNAYFWGGESRRANERNKDGEWRSGYVEFYYNGRCYRYELEISFSRQNAYCTTNKLTVDGGGSLRDWKKLYKEVSGEDYPEEDKKEKD